MIWIFKLLLYFLFDSCGNEFFFNWFCMMFLIVFKIVVFFLEYFIVVIIEVVFDDIKEIEFISKVISVFIFRIMECFFVVKLNDVCKEIGIMIEEVFIFGFVKEDIFFGVFKKGVCE